MHRPPASPATVTDSDLLAHLRLTDRALFEALGEDCHLAAGEMIYRPGDPIDHCFFPTGAAICAFFVDLESGGTVETVLVGREGALGGIVSQGTLPAFAHAMVVHGGRFRRVAVSDLEGLKQQSPAIAALFARYADCMMAQMFQSIACNAAHTIEQRTARWLIAAVDRIGRNQVTLTQEQLARMMGIGRSYASRVLQRFKRDGLLRTRRGSIEVLDGEALRNRACSCNDRVKAHFGKVLGGVYSAED